MGNPKCAVCGRSMKKNGRTTAGTQRWRCPSCGASGTRKIDRSAKALELFLRWLLSKDATSELKMSRSTFWRKTSWVWGIWPIAPYTGEVHDVVHLDGIWMRRDAAVLVAWADGHVLAWCLAKTECTSAWAALMARIPAPVMAVSDGSPGLAKAARMLWPKTRIQRRAFHVASQVRRYTTLRPRLEAGSELLGMANSLGRVSGPESAARWLADFAAWCSRWESFLKEYTIKDGRRVYVHERLRKARRSLIKVVREKTLFTFIEMQQLYGGSWPSTNNAIESVNSRLRDMLRHHRGMPLLHRVKAVFWWCYLHTESPLSAAEILRVMPTDAEVDGLFAAASRRSGRQSGGPEEYGAGIDWNEFHMPTEFRR